MECFRVGGKKSHPNGGWKQELITSSECYHNKPQNCSKPNGQNVNKKCFHRMNSPFKCDSFALISAALLFIVIVSNTSLFVTAQDSVSNSTNLKFLQPPRPPRIYAQAPSGVGVTRVRGVYVHGNVKNETKNGQMSRDEVLHRNCIPAYELVNSSQFEISRCEGVIQTSRYIDAEVGEMFPVVIEAKDKSNDTLGSLVINITVTSYNSIQPRLTRASHSLEVLDITPLDTVVDTLTATDNDTEEYNRQLFFSLQHSSDSDKDPWLFPSDLPLKINTSTGEIAVSKSLLNISSPLLFEVGLSDGGSPQRTYTAKMVVHIRKISAPRQVVISNIDDTTLKVCWSSPVIGFPSGYTISYLPRSAPRSQFPPPTPINLTMEELQSYILKDSPRRMNSKSTRPRRYITIQPEIIVSTLDEYDPAEYYDSSYEFDIPDHSYNDLDCVPYCAGRAKRAIPAHRKPKKVSRYCYPLSSLQEGTVYIVAVQAWSDEEGISMAHQPKAFSTRRKNCLRNTCKNGICSEQDRPPGYSCMCSAGYTGLQCQNRIGCKEECLNGGTCKNVQGNYVCECTNMFFGSRCEKPSPCYEATCENSGQCHPVDGGQFRCTCPPPFTGPKCEFGVDEISENPPCSFDKISLPEGEFLWPITQSGQITYLECPFGIVTRHDVGNYMVEAKQEVPISSKNDSEYYNYESVNVDDARLVDDVEMSEEMPKAVRRCKDGRWQLPDVSSCKTGNEGDQMVRDKSSEVEVMSAEQILLNVKEVENIVGDAIRNKTVARRMVGLINDMMSVNYTNLPANEADKVVQTLENYTANVDLKPGENLTLKTENVIVHCRVVDRNEFKNGISFRPYEGTTIPIDDDILHTTVESNTQISDRRIKRSVKKSDDIWIKIPKEILDHFLDETIRIQFVSFNDGRFFKGDETQDVPSQPVLSATVKSHTISNLKHPVTFKIPVGQDAGNERIRCVYWNKEYRIWSSSGLEVVKIGDSVHCSSSHLTSFSVLLDPVGTAIPDSHSTPLTVITFVGLLISTIALIATIATFSALRVLRRERSGFIVLQLSIALTILNIAFVFAWLGRFSWACVPTAVLLHYVVCSAFIWMLIEGENMYQMLITVFPPVETHFMAKRMAVGWGLPVLFVLVALIWNPAVYATYNKDICAISVTVAPYVFYATYLIPICVVLSLNVIVFMLVSRVLCCSQRPSGQVGYIKRSVTMGQIRGTITIVALLGVTWLFGLFGVGHLRLTFQYLFCFTTPLQGLIIFFVRVVQSPDAQKAWKSYSLRVHKYPQSVSLRTQNSTQNTSYTNQHTNSSYAGTRSSWASAINGLRKMSFIGSSSRRSSKRARSFSKHGGSEYISKKAMKEALHVDNNGGLSKVVEQQMKDSKSASSFEENIETQNQNPIKIENETGNLSSISNSDIDNKPKNESGNDSAEYVNIFSRENLESHLRKGSKYRSLTNIDSPACNIDRSNPGNNYKFITKSDSNVNSSVFEKENSHDKNSMLTDMQNRSLLNTLNNYVKGNTCDENSISHFNHGKKYCSRSSISPTDPAGLPLVDDDSRVSLPYGKDQNSSLPSSYPEGGNLLGPGRDYLQVSLLKASSENIVYSSNCPNDDGLTRRSVSNRDFFDEPKKSSV